jgi:hypothetical protein
MADNSTPTTVSPKAPVKTYQNLMAERRTKKKERDLQIQEDYELFCEDESNWVYVRIPEKDLFDKPFGNISLNLIEYGSGTHFVRPDVGKQLSEILASRYHADMRILRPTADKKMLEIMARSGRAVTTAGTTLVDNVVGNENLPTSGYGQGAYPTL